MNMADRVLRGSRLGAISYETEYAAELPATWECRLDGTTAKAVDLPEPEPKKIKAPRTHWDMLIERRTIADLEEVLAERLDVLRARRGGPGTKSPKTA